MVCKSKYLKNFGYQYSSLPSLVLVVGLTQLRFLVYFLVLVLIYYDPNLPNPKDSLFGKLVT